ncbi:cutinase [Mycolicibacterium acapulense]|uniref:Cutinase n=1 Tax=Mycobacterium lehmannii TaxID=2048550 RepID=A0A101A2B7_9MYCO|nr:cutinase [Mycolicibacterium acapulense]KUI11630.1 cutinase [Mycobacterium lehmannii]
MDFARLRRRFTGAAVVAATGLTPSVLAPPLASAQGCSDVTVVFARGTGEPPGIGRVGQAFVDALRPQLGDRTLSAYGVAYPATYDFVMAADGAADAAAFVTNTAQSCPDSRIVLGGFSQGAAVVDMLAGIPPLGNRIGALGPVLPPNVAPNVAAVAVFGNPATKFGNPITSAPIFGGRAIDLCTDGDPICSRGRNPFAHSDYVGAGMANRAADFVARLV